MDKQTTPTTLTTLCRTGRNVLIKLTVDQLREMYEDYIHFGRPLKYYAEKYRIDSKTVSEHISKMMAETKSIIKTVNSEKCS